MSIDDNECLAIWERSDKKDKRPQPQEFDAAARNRTIDDDNELLQMKHKYIESLKDKSDLTLKSYDDFKENSKQWRLN
ncbi:hypothetical protein AGMMS50222_10720 [Endomicrobiia bacterium]|nr:hypothetical protein AGMMS49556_06030 [Endomicrobiia bacterium]GHT77291.1 hypothetical protein AGMMS50222_10720 [Endomicrobiia bacterium]